MTEGGNLVNINIDDIQAIQRLLEALDGEIVRKVEAETIDNKITAYCIRDNQVRVDIVDKAKKAG